MPVELWKTSSFSYSLKEVFQVDVEKSEGAKRNGFIPPNAELWEGGGKARSGFPQAFHKNVRHVISTGS